MNESCGSHLLKVNAVVSISHENMLWTSGEEEWETKMDDRYGECGWYMIHEYILCTPSLMSKCHVLHLSCVNAVDSICCE